MSIQKQDQIYEGKVKKIYATDSPNHIWVEFKDDATAFNGVKKDSIAQKGILTNQISALIFTYLKKKSIANHFVQTTSDTECICKKVEIIPIEVIMRNIVAGSLKKRTGFEEGTPLSRPILEWYYKNDALGDPMINEDHILVFQWATQAELDRIRTLSQTINTELKEMFRCINLILVDFKLEFGRFTDESGNPAILLADEISPDTCRLWDATTHQKMDKDLFRFDLGDLRTSYEEVYQRLKTIA